MNNYCKLEDSEYIKYLKNKIENLKQEINYLKNSLHNSNDIIQYPEIISIDDEMERFYSHANIRLFTDSSYQYRKHFIGVARDKEKEQICYQYFINDKNYLDRELYKQILLEMHKRLICEVMKDEV